MDRREPAFRYRSQKGGGSRMYPICRAVEHSLNVSLSAALWTYSDDHAHGRI